MYIIYSLCRSRASLALEYYIPAYQFNIEWQGDYISGPQSWSMNNNDVFIY